MRPAWEEFRHGLAMELQPSILHSDLMSMSEIVFLHGCDGLQGLYAHVHPRRGGGGERGGGLCVHLHQ